MQLAETGGFTIRAIIVNGPDASYNYSWDLYAIGCKPPAHGFSLMHL